MFLKNRSMKTRIVCLSFFIMILTVISIMLTEYILQQNMGTIAINMEDVNIPDSSLKQESIFDSGTSGEVQEDTAISKQEMIMKATEQFKALQRAKFVRLVIISTVILSAGLFLIYQLLRKELLPLKVLEKDMNAMDFQDKDQQLPVSKSHSAEIISLTNSYNIMISKLKKSYELQKRFSQNAAHELKTPITTMKTSLQVHKILPHLKDEETENLLAVLEGQTLRMEALISGLMLLNNQKGITSQVIDAKPVIQDLLQTFQDKIKAKKLEVSIEGHALIETDLTLFSVILKNLTENAIRYNKEGGFITFRLTSDSIEISDTGIGISPEEQERIFSPFYCVDPSRSKEFGGFGLGLSIVKEGIDQLGLKLELNSVLGEGTTFRILY